MILVHINTDSRAQALEIIDVLLENKLWFKPTLSRKQVFEKHPETGALKSKPTYLVIGKAKSLLFNNINQLLVKMYPHIDKMPRLYCLPIVYMAPENAEELLEQSVKINL